MKNSTFKNFNIKRTLIVCFCLLLGLGFSSLFVLNQNNKIESVSAQTVVSVEDGERELVFENQKSNLVSMSSLNYDVGIAANAFEQTTDHITYSSSKTVPTTLNGGSKLKFLSETNGRLSVRIYPANDNGVASTEASNEIHVWVTPEKGYELVQQTVGSDKFYFTVNGKGVNINSTYTLEDLDSNYSGKIEIKAKAEAILFSTDFYYENATGAYSKAVQLYSVESEESGLIDSKSLSNTPTNKIFNGWVFDNGKVSSSKYNGYDVSINTSSKKITLSKDIGKTTEVCVYLKYNSIIDAQYYDLNSIWGFGNLSISSTSPLIIARWKNRYTATISIGNANYWDSYSLQNTYESTITSSVQFCDGGGAGMTTVFGNAGDDAFSKNGWVYNYGHYVLKWDVYVGGYYYDYYYPGNSLKSLASSIDDSLVGQKGVPTVSFTANWSAVEITNSNLENGKINYGGAYNLKASTNGSGKTFFAYENNKKLVAALNGGIWNYTGLSYNYTSHGKYSISLTSVQLDNVYKVDLIDAVKDGNVYTISGSTFADSDNKITAGTLTYTDSNLAGSVPAYSSSSYPLIDNYITKLTTYQSNYLAGINGDGVSDYDIFNYTHYDYGAASGSTLTASSEPAFWVYLANAQPYKLPSFENKYSKGIVWISGSTKFKASLYDSKFDKEIGTPASQWTYTHTKLNAYYANTLYLYKANGSGYKEHVAVDTTGVDGLFTQKTPLDFSSTCADWDNGNKVFNGWVFDYAKAVETYTVEGTPDVGKTIKAVHKTTDKTTTFTVSGVSTYSSAYFFVSIVQGDAFIQDETDPIIKMMQATKFTFNINNNADDIYWKDFDSTKTDNDLYGAWSTENEGEYTTSVTVANKPEYAYPFMLSNRTSFTKKSGFTADNSAAVGERYYYVYNYGHYVSGWTITTSFADLSITYTSTDTFAMVAQKLDDYMFAKGITEAPTVTLTPSWATTTIKHADLTADVVFGEQYSFKDKSLNGKTLFAYQDGSEHLVALNGVWNYHANGTELSGYSQVTYGVYSISLTAFGLNNIYKINLNGAVSYNNDDLYKLTNYAYAASSVASDPCYTYKTINSVSEYTFVGYNNEILIDEYILDLASYKAAYEAGAAGGFSIFNKVYTNGTIDAANNTATIASSDFYIYLAHETNIAALPEFEHDLSKLVYWVDQNRSNIVYITASWLEGYSAEISGKSKNTQWMWTNVTGFALNAGYVYSVRLYYNVGTTYDDSFNAGYFGKNTKLDNLHTNYIAPAQSSKEFEKWIFDKERAQSAGYTVSGSSSPLTVTHATNGVSFKVYFSGKNSDNTNLYYITGIQGVGRMSQDASAPIIYVKWLNLYNVIIDNTYTYWKDVKSEVNLYGAKAKNGETENGTFTASLIVGNKNIYAYAYQSSEINTSSALSFHQSGEYEGNTVNATNGYYYVYNYGHYITGWELRFILNGTTYYINSSWKATTTPATLTCAQLTSQTMQRLAAVVDEFAIAQRTTSIAAITITPKWEEVNVSVRIDSTYAQSTYNTTFMTGTFADKSGYTLNSARVKSVDGKSIIAYYYGDNEANTIAASGLWNYASIPYATFTYSRSSGVVGSGTYTITLKPIYVDNVYKINLTNIPYYKVGESSYKYLLTKAQEDETYFTYNSAAGDNCNTQNSYVLDFNHSFNIISGGKYEFKEYADEVLIDSYIANLQAYIETYRKGIETDGDNRFEVFKTVYFSTGEVIDNALTTETKPEDQKFHIYLANDHQTGILPVFEKQYYTLIYWRNEYPNPDFVYATNQFDINIHEEELRDFNYHKEENEGMWFFKDGYDKSNANFGNITWKAEIYRKNYEIKISTMQDELVERRGYVKFEIDDEIPEDEENKSGTYFVIYDYKTSSMKIYEYKSGYLINNWDAANNKYTGKEVEEIRLYAGCNITMTVYDQSKDAYSMAAELNSQYGWFDDMIGFKFTKELKQTLTKGESVVETEFFKEANVDDEYVYSLTAGDVEAKQYANKTQINVGVCFERIQYSMEFKIDNYLAGQFNVTGNATNTGFKTSITLDDVAVLNGYKVEYSAYAGYMLKDNAFVYNNGSSSLTFLTYDDETLLGQDYIITENYYSNYTLDGTWLRSYFYSAYTDYSVTKVALGTFTINTCPIEFNLGIKVYDETDGAFVNDGYIIETSTEYNKFIFEEKAGKGLTPEIYTYLSDDLGFYYYKSLTDVEYALLSSRLYFTNDYLTTKDNYYTTYSFLLNEKPINQASIDSTILARMVERYEEGKIISADDRNIYIMLEVRKLLTIDMSVAGLEFDTNSSVRTTTLSNADNNEVSITINPNAELVAEVAAFALSPILGYYKNNLGETVVVVYTYFGLENTIISEFDSSCYGYVEYVLNGAEQLETTFAVEENSSLVIKYVPDALNVEFVYMLEGEVKTLEELETYIIENVNLKPNPTSVYHIGDFLAYEVECCNPDYDITVTINNVLKGASNATSRKVSLTEDNRYQVTTSDYEIGKIQVVVNVKIQNNEKISIQYQLNNPALRLADDNYGTFNVYEGVNIKAQEVKTAEISVIAGRDVFVQLNLPKGYKYVGIKHNTYTPQEPQADENGKIMIVGDFNPETHSGSYLILIEKIAISATLDVSNVNPNSKYTINNSLFVTDLHVGDGVYFGVSKSVEEEYYNFYYIDKENNKEDLIDDSGNALTSIRITNEFLDNIAGTVIEFGVCVEEKFKLDLTVVGEEFIKPDGLKMEVHGTTEVYESGTYKIKNTVIELTVETLVTGKYNINFNDVDYDIIGRGAVLITLDQNCDYTLTVEPKAYNIQEEYYLYTTLDAVDKNIPDLTIEDVNSIENGGYVYNSIAKLLVNRKPSEGELYAMIISGNDYENDLVIIFNNNMCKAYKVVEDEKIEIDLQDYDIEIKFADAVIEFAYLINNHINIRFEYKQYKLITG